MLEVANNKSIAPFRLDPAILATLLVSTLALSYVEFLNQYVLKIVVPLLVVLTIFHEGYLTVKFRGFRLYIALFLWAALSLFYTLDVSLTLRYLQIILGNIMVWYVAETTIRRINKFTSVLYPILVATGIQLYFALSSSTIEAEYVVNQGLERISGLSSDANDLGYLLFFGLACCIILSWLTRSIISRLLYALFTAAFLWGIFRAGSRSALIVSIIFLMISLTLFIKKSNYHVIIPIVVMMGIISFLGYDYVLNQTPVGLRMKIALASSEDSDTRILLAKEAWQTFVSSPFMGIGLGSYVQASMYHKSSHNDYLEILATMGLPALIIYVLILFDYLKKASVMFAKKYRYGEMVACISFLVAYIFIGIFRPSFYYLNSVMVFACFSSWISKSYSEFKAISRLHG